MSEKPLVPTYCYFQGCYNPDYEEEIRKGNELCHRCNALSPNDREAQAEILASLLGHVGRETYITPLLVRLRISYPRRGLFLCQS